MCICVCVCKVRIRMHLPSSLSFIYYTLCVCTHMCMALYQCHNSREGCGFYLRGVSISFGDGSETFEVCLLRLGIDIFNCMVYFVWGVYI